MSNIEKIRQEVERRKKENMYVDLPMSIGRYYEDRDLLAFIDSLPEEKPSEDLEEAAEKWCKENGRGFVLRDKAAYYIGETLPAFIAGAEWQKEQMMKDAVVSEIGITSGGILLRDLRIEDFDYEDKVCIIIVKEE